MITIRHAHERGHANYGWGSVSLNGHEMKTSDGAAVSEQRLLTILAEDEAEVMLFDLA